MPAHEIGSEVSAWRLSSTMMLDKQSVFTVLLHRVERSVKISNLVVSETTVLSAYTSAGLRTNVVVLVDVDVIHVQTRYNLHSVHTQHTLACLSDEEERQCDKQTKNKICSARHNMHTRPGMTRSQLEVNRIICGGVTTAKRFRHFRDFLVLDFKGKLNRPQCLRQLRGRCITACTVAQAVVTGCTVVQAPC